MSRSYKKHPFLAIACYFSNKKDKRIANRLFRRISKINLRLGKEPKHSLKEVSDTYLFSSDGLASYKDKHCYDYLLRLGKTEEYVKNLYRKIFSK